MEPVRAVLGSKVRCGGAEAWHERAAAAARALRAGDGRLCMLRLPVTSLSSNWSYVHVLTLQGKFFEAKCTDIMPESKEIVACFPGAQGRGAYCCTVAGWTCVGRAGCVCGGSVPCHSTVLAPCRPGRRRARPPLSCSRRPAHPRRHPTEDAGFPEACFKIPYDYLVLGVG